MPGRARRWGGSASTLRAPPPDERRARAPGHCEPNAPKRRGDPERQRRERACAAQGRALEGAASSGGAGPPVENRRVSFLEAAEAPVKRVGRHQVGRRGLAGRRDEGPHTRKPTLQSPSSPLTEARTYEPTPAGAESPNELAVELAKVHIARGAETERPDRRPAADLLLAEQLAGHATLLGKAPRYRPVVAAPD